MTKKQAALIQKLDKHPRGPIELTQDECAGIAGLIEAVLDKLELCHDALQVVEATIGPQAGEYCGLAGGSVVVHAVEHALGKRKLRN